MPSDTKEVLANYRDASHRMALVHDDWVPTPEVRIRHRELARIARDLVSRCIESDDRDVLIELVSELMIFTRTLGANRASEHLRQAGLLLVENLGHSGVFGD